MFKIENLVPRNWRNVKTHNLISTIKSEDTYGYVPDYTKPLTCIGCHIGFILIRSDRVWLNILLDNKNPRYRHWNRLPMLLASKTTGYLIFWRLCQFILIRVIMKKCSIVIIRHPAILNNWGTIQLIFVVRVRGTCHFRFHCVLYKQKD